MNLCIPTSVDGRTQSLTYIGASAKTSTDPVSRVSFPSNHKTHTHQAIHDHANRIFDRLPVGMRHWNVHI